MHVDEVDVVIASERPVFTLDDDRQPTSTSRSRRTPWNYIADGCTLQSGIGGVPSTVMSLLANEAGGDYGVHSEMFTTGLMHLQRGGQGHEPPQGNLRRILGHDLRAGTPELYEWLDGNPDVRFLPVDVVNAART